MKHTVAWSGLVVPAPEHNQEAYAYCLASPLLPIWSGLVILVSEWNIRTYLVCCQLPQLSPHLRGVSQQPSALAQLEHKAKGLQHTCATLTAK